MLLKLFQDGRSLEYKKGEYIIRPGEAPPGVFYIERGTVKSFDITKYGEENLLIIRVTGELLGLTFTITEDLRDIAYVALAPTTLRLVPHQQFSDFLRSNPEAALPVLDMIADMYKWHSEHIISLEYRSVRERLTAFLLMMARRFGEQTPEGIRLTVPLRHQDIASSINSSRETTSRELSNMHRKGLLANAHPHQIVITDLPALQKTL